MFLSVKIGEGGIRTPGRVAPAQTFQVCTLNHSDTSPSVYILSELLIFSKDFFTLTLFMVPHSIAALLSLFKCIKALPQIY